MSTEVAPVGAISINLAEMQEVISLAVRRVSAFLRFGLDGVEDRDGGDFVLSAGAAFSFWPPEVPKEMRDAARNEFRAWLIGCCLRELNLFYGLFLDKVWFSIEVLHLHGTKVPSSYQFDGRFAKDTNVAKKQEKVAGKLKIVAYLEELNSMSLARNALTHNAGVVRAPVDCNDPERTALNVRWLGFDMIASRSGHETVVDEFPFDTHKMPGEGEIKVGVKFSSRTLTFKPGTPIKFSNSQIAEFCMFYKILCDTTIDALASQLRHKGILLTKAEESVVPSES